MGELATIPAEGVAGEQLLAVWRIVRDGAWHTIPEIAAAARAPEASVSTRLRDLRKPQYGGWNVEARRHRDRSHEYRVVAP